MNNIKNIYELIQKSKEFDILLHTPAAQPNSSTYTYPGAPAKESIIKYTLYI